MRESSTGAEAGTSPKDGENIRSSEFSEDLAQETRLCESEFKPNRSTRRRGNVRESSTGAEAGTFPKDGENIRSSELSEDRAQETRLRESEFKPNRSTYSFLRFQAIWLEASS